MKLCSVFLLLPLCVAAIVLTLPESASAQTSDWTFCASEGSNCNFSGTTQVRYGANGAYVYATLTDGTQCTNAVFGDPAPGIAKSCAVASGEWTLCAFEGGFCAFGGTGRTACIPTKRQPTGSRVQTVCLATLRPTSRSSAR